MRVCYTDCACMQAPLRDDIFCCPEVVGVSPRAAWPGCRANMLLLFAKVTSFSDDTANRHVVVYEHVDTGRQASLLYAANERGSLACCIH